MKFFEGKTVSSESACMYALMAAIAGALIGAWLMGDQKTYQTANECVMDQLGDMQTDEAVGDLVQFCRWEYGDFDRG